MDGTGDGRRPTKLVLGGVGLFLVAVVLGRLLLAGGAAWVAFALTLPILVFVLSAAVSLRFGLLVAALFSLLVLGIRFFLERNPLGWIALALLPIVVFTAVLVGRVLGQLRRDRNKAPPGSDEHAD